MVSEKGFDSASAEEKQSQESENTGNQNTRTHNQTVEKDSVVIKRNAINNDLPSFDIFDLDEKRPDFSSRPLIVKNEKESIQTNKSSRNASIDSTEDSGDWEDLEPPKYLPHFSSREECLNESRIQFSVMLFISL